MRGLASQFIFHTYYYFINYTKNAIIDLSIGSTETKYIQLKNKTQNNIVIFGIFSKKNIVILFLFFEKIWPKYKCVQKKSAVLGLLVFRLSNG